LVLIALALDSAAVAAQEPLRWSKNEPGESRPITLYADSVSTWVDQGRRVILLKGRVWIEQGVIHIRQTQGVVWIDEEQKQRTGIYHLDIYGEGDVTLDDGPQMRSGARALIELNTRGEIKLQAYQGKVGQAAALADPLYARASAVKNSPVARENAAGTLTTSNLRGPTSADPAPRGLTPPAQDAALQQTAGVESVVPVPAVPVQQPWVPGGQAQPMQQGGPGPMSPPGVFPAPTSPDIYPVPAVPLVPPPAPVAPAVPAPQAAGPPPAKTTPPPGNAPPRQIMLRPRYSREIQWETNLVNGENETVINTGIILTITNVDDKNGILDVEADRLVLWTRGNTTQEMVNNMRSPQGQQVRDVQFYLAGNVEIRSRQGKDERVLRASEVYYDVSRSVAVALTADLEVKQPLLSDPLHVKAQELDQLNAKVSHVIHAEVFSSKLPSDPGVKVVVADGDLEEKEVLKKSIFGRQVISRATGEPEKVTQDIFTGRNAVIDLEIASDFYVPIFYWPWLRVDVRDPLGPLQSIGFNYNRIFGFEFLTTFDVFDLLGVDRQPGTRWRMNVDYLTARGPALGMQYDATSKELWGIPGVYTTSINAYGIDDTGLDILGYNRGQMLLVTPTDDRFISHTPYRGRFSTLFNAQDLPDGFTVQARTYAISDRNFMEQYFPNEYYNGPEEETSIYVKQQEGIWAWTALAQTRIQYWMTETDYLPKVDGYVIGEKFFGLFTYNVRGDATFAQLQPADIPPPTTPTTRYIETGRVDLMQEISLPFTLGPFKVVPYATLDLAAYTEDLADQERGRVYGGVGVRASIPFSRLYPDIQSELFNVDGIYHKIVVSGNFYAAHSDTSFLLLPELDRLNDMNSDRALRDIHPWDVYFYPNGTFIANSPIYDTQRYAIRMLLDNSIDTLDSIEVLQFDIRQRWQTKRGYSGQEHVIDWMTLDLGAALFPVSERDDFGHTLGFLTYDYAWNIGDRTAIFSSGLFEPFENGARAFNMGVSINRPDRTNFTFSYRQIDPVDSKAVIASATYAFSAKYAATATTLYDFGNKNVLLAATVSRIGTDLQLNVGINYSTLVNTFGFQVEIIPNVVPANQRGAPGTGGLGSSLLGSR